MLTISGLYIYPIKSLRGISKQSVELTSKGFKYDRQWMLVDQEGQFLSQRILPKMALLQPEETIEGFRIFDIHHQENAIVIPYTVNAAETISVKVWEDSCTAVLVGEAYDQWFSAFLGVPCRLVYMPEEERRLVDPRYAHRNEITTFTDGFPILMIGQSSLDLLNTKIESKVSIDRFRPNVVFTGGGPHKEDNMLDFEINGIQMHGVKLCARCTITTIDTQTAEKQQEPLKTLSFYRKFENKIMFGQNVIHDSTGNIKLGDVVRVLKCK